MYVQTLVLKCGLPGLSTLQKSDGQIPLNAPNVVNCTWCTQKECDSGESSGA